MKELKEIQKSVEDLRIKVYAGQSVEDNEKALYEIELMLFKSMDVVISSGDIHHVMPNWRDFKPRRQKLNLSMQDVANMCGCSKATISRLEKGNEVYYSTVKSIHECYLSNGV